MLFEMFSFLFMVFVEEGSLGTVEGNRLWAQMCFQLWISYSLLEDLG